MQKKQQPNGFAVVEVVIIILVMVAIGFTGWYIWHTNHNKTTAKTNSSSSTKSSKANTSNSSAKNSTVVSTTDGKVSITLPNNWEVSSQYLQNKTPVIGAGTNSSCINISDPSPCLYQASFLPTTIVDGTYGSITSGNSAIANDAWLLTVEQTSWDMSEAISQVGGFSQANTISENDNPVNGYTAHFIKGYYGPPQTIQSGMAFYTIEYKGYLAVFKEDILPIGGQTNPVTLTSSFDSEFANIAQSIKFNF